MMNVSSKSGDNRQDAADGCVDKSPLLQEGDEGNVRRNLDADGGGGDNASLLSPFPLKIPTMAATTTATTTKVDPIEQGNSSQTRNENNSPPRAPQHNNYRYNQCVNLSEEQEEETRSRKSEFSTRNLNVSDDIGIGTTTNNKLPSEPLSWYEARSRMKVALEDYMSTSHFCKVDHQSSSIQNNTDGDGDGGNNSNADGYNDNDDVERNIGKIIKKRYFQLIAWLSLHNIDCYCGSILFSIVLLILSIDSFVQEQEQQQRRDDANANGNEQNADGEENNYHPTSSAQSDQHKSYIIASSIYAVVSIISMWSIHRRKEISTYDVYLKRKRNVSTLIETLNELEIEAERTESNYYYSYNTQENEQQQQRQQHKHTNDVIPDDIGGSGSSLNDIYSVYRLSPSSPSANATMNISSNSNSNKRNDMNVDDERGKGRWHNIPSLLLVKGDFIALQTGDIAPADCKMVNGSRFSSLGFTNRKQQQQVNNRTKKPMSASFHSKHGDGMIIKSGEMVQSPHRAAMSTKASGEYRNNNNIQGLNPWFPPGKSALPEKSRKLLHLCNNKRVFEVLEAPITKFLQLDTVTYQSPQVHRKLSEIRGTMYMLSLAMFILTLFIVLARSGIEGVHHRQHFYLPLMTALSILPICTPSILFIQEIVGTARILQFTHPLSSQAIHCGRDKASSLQSMKLFLTYFFEGLRSRFSLSYQRTFSNRSKDSALIHFPPISMCLFEKLGMVTASTFIDDELICSPISTPEQLLIPSNNGLKLLDLFQKHDETEELSADDDTSSEYQHSSRAKLKTLRRFLSSASDDSDSDWGDDIREPVAPSRKRRRPLANLRRRIPLRRESSELSLRKTIKEIQDTIEVQFEDPSWWRYLPSLKCIGLSCLILEDNKRLNAMKAQPPSSDKLVAKTWKNSQGQNEGDNRFRYFHGQAESALVSQICRFQSRNHLRLLSECIGFTTHSNLIGNKGDMSPFEERKRINVVATRLLQERAHLDRHTIGFQESRTWGLLQPDSTSIIIKDSRTGAHQLLTLGDARVVTEFCSDSWQGGISTITPLSQADRKEIIENNRKWSLADYDVTAFSYAPIPCSHEQKLGSSETYLVDNRTSNEIPAVIQKDCEDWSLLKNQIFLGLLGSSVSPRKCIAHIIQDCDSAGVRFVYFSPRNMRRTKEVAREMGIDVSWNSAISLLPLLPGEDDEDLRDTFGEADINARLPHGVEAVVRHLKEVDNVPLLVRLYTDATKACTAEMIKIFQEQSDTVLTIGLSHLSRNEKIFSKSSLSFGVDVYSMEDPTDTRSFNHRLSPKEASIISSIAANSCIFNMPLGHGVAHLTSIIDAGRGALNAGTAAVEFMVVAYISFSVLVLFSPCSISTSVPFVPGIGSVLYLLLVVPLIGIAMVFTAADEDSMTIVPTKNEKTVAFARGERQRLCIYILSKSVLPAAMSQLLFLVSFGSLIIEFDSKLILNECGLEQTSWRHVIRCDALISYAGPSNISSGALMIAFQTMCMIAISSSFLLGTTPIYSKPSPLGKNKIWIGAITTCILLILLYLSLTLEKGVLKSLPWYFYFLSLVFPLICLAACELVKISEKKHEQRAAKMRRLHFETRLGMWSPK